MLQPTRGGIGSDESTYEREREQQAPPEPVAGPSTKVPKLSERVVDGGSSAVQGSPARQRDEGVNGLSASLKANDLVADLYEICSNRELVSSSTARKIGRGVLALQALVVELSQANAVQEGRVQGLTMGAKAARPTASYAKVLAGQEPSARVALPTGAVPVWPTKNVVMVYPVDAARTSDQTRAVVCKTLAPIVKDVRIRRMRNVARGGVAVEAGDAETISRLKSAAAGKAEQIRVHEPQSQQPKVMLFDVPRELADAGTSKLLQTVHEKNFSESGMSLTEFQTGMQVLIRAGPHDAPVVNMVFRCAPAVRRRLVDAGRVYLDYTSCRVADHVAPMRCYKCQRTGHSSQRCHNSERCGRCAGEHGTRDCKSGDAVCCINCKRSGVGVADHPAYSRDCPALARAIAQEVARTLYD